MDSKQNLRCYRIKAEGYVDRLQAALEILDRALQRSDSPPDTEPDIHPLPDAEAVRHAVRGLYTEAGRAKRLGIDN